MATALKNIGPHLECIICADKYKQPKVLDCMHSFCQKCLEKYYTSRYAGQPKIPCPVCRRETVLPETRIQGLKTNFHLMGIVEEVSLQEKVVSSENTKVTCEICDEGNEAMHRCLDCAQNICSNCRKTHLRCTATSNHTVATLEDIRQGKVTVKKTPEEDESRCHKHKGEVKRFYCETCEELICRDCTVVDHCKPEHHYIDSGEASRKYKQSMKDTFPDFTTGIKRLEQALTTSSQVKQKFTQNVTKTVKAVQDKADKMRAEITTQETKMIKEIKQLQQDRNRTYDEHQSTLTMMLESKKHSLGTSQDIINTASDSDFLSLYPIISKDLKSLKSQNTPQIDPKLSYLSFTPGHGYINLGKLDGVEAVKWEMCRKFGKRGSGRGEFNLARGITATQPGEIAVADMMNNRVVICSNEGQHKGTILLKSNPVAVAAIHNHEQCLLVLDLGNKYVKVFNMKDNTLVMQFPTMLKHQVDKTKMNLQSLAVTKNSILVGDTNNMVWTEHRPTDGEILRTIPVQTPPHFLAVDDDTDRVVVSGGNTKKVVVGDTKGRTIWTINPTINGEPVGNCKGVCCDSSGIYLAIAMHQGVSDTGHIHHYDQDGRFLNCLAQGLYDPQGIAFTSDGQLAVADWFSIKMFHKV
ncbi:tripartite motif-containing protein 3-like [Patiria miniata]|uniref:Tripartite motif-containing protein 2-like n=1 Tax=Patiria miniata TaxID=46514 RepID=A0A914AFA1_PATMI|nr:tripartite motif-containing protein 3-like [Patiria miniata]